MNTADTFNPFTTTRKHFADIGGFIRALELEERGVADFVVPDRAMRIVTDMTETVTDQGVDESLRPLLAFDHETAGSCQFPMNRHAADQLAERFGVARKYARRMEEEAVDLYGTNFNYWMKRGDKTRLVRTLHGTTRAVLSQNYRIVDNLDLAHEILTRVKGKAPKAELFSWGLDEATMNLAVFDPTSAIRLPSTETLSPEVRKFIEGPLRGTIQDPEYERNGVVERMIIADGRDPNAGGDLVFPGLVAGNSQVGTRTAWVKVGLFVASCSNRFLVGEDIAHRHLGKDLSKNADAITSRETRTLENEVVFSRIRDAVDAVFVPGNFQKHVGALCDTMTVGVPSATDAVDHLVVREKWGTRKEKGSGSPIGKAILAAWKPQVSHKTSTAWDLLQATTAAAQAIEEAMGADLAMEMEEKAGAYIGKSPEYLAKALGGVVLS